MRPRLLPTSDRTRTQHSDTARLFLLCAEDRDNPLLWSELLRRISPKIKHFIRGTLRQSAGLGTQPSGSLHSFGGVQESDLFQSTIVRLVENDCRAMKRFSGSGEEQLMAYLAVITRSVVRDCMRRLRAKKRPLISASVSDLPWLKDDWRTSDSGRKQASAERKILGREVEELSQKILAGLKGQFSDRDRLIFRLYFYHDLSFNQISQCRGINLSKAGVEKVVHRLKDRIRKDLSAGSPYAGTT